MEFRPCIDIHNGKVKQIVGSSLRDAGDQASENFVSGQDAPFYARMYQSRGIRGGHIILQNAKRKHPHKNTQKQPQSRNFPHLYHNACKRMCFLEKLCFPGINHDMGFTTDFR